MNQPGFHGSSLRPFFFLKEVWSLLLKLREEGLCKAVGVSNFGVGQLEGEQCNFSMSNWTVFFVGFIIYCYLLAKFVSDE